MSIIHFSNPSMVAGSDGEPVEALGDFYWPLNEASGNAVESINEIGSQALTAAAPLSYSQTSLREDGAGTSIRVVGSTNSKLTNLLNIIPPYSGGITVEVIMTPHVKNDSGLPSRRTAGALVSRGADMMWTFQWDNFDDVEESNVDLLPVFVIKPNAGNYWDESDIPPDPVDAYIRGTVPVVINNTYHIMITFRPSANDSQLWINGDSIGVSSLGSFLTQNILDGLEPTAIELAGSVVVGSRQSPNVTYDELKIHLLEADQAFATQQASFANFT